MPPVPRPVLLGSALGVGAVLAAGSLAAATAGTRAGAAVPGDLACGRAATATSTASGSAGAASDCDTSTGWQSAAARPQELGVDLGAAAVIDHVSVAWGAGYATSFKVRTSPDGTTWHTQTAVTSGHGGTQTVTLPSGTDARFIELYLQQYNGSSGFQVNEFEVFGTPGGPTPTPTPTPTATPTPTPTPTATPTPTGSPGGPTVKVSTAAQLTAALTAAKPGQTIQLAPGTYSGVFLGTTSGTANAPITLTGPTTAVLTNPDTTGTVGAGYGLHLVADYWRLTGFSVADSAKGIVLDHSNNDVLDGLSVHNIGDEGIHLREFSTHDIVEHSTVHDTGLKAPGYGEGVYVGTANSNWGTYTDGKPDLSNDDQIIDNTFGPNVAAENIDIKEATSGGLISGNTFSGKGESGANSSTDVVAVKGNDYTVTGNTMSNGLIDGFEVEQLYTGSGCGNVFRNNTINLAAPGYGFDVKDQSSCAASPNVVGVSNTVTGAAKGVSKIPLTPGL
jgi:hypothetical protein